jgi:hypothetical protein
MRERRTLIALAAASVALALVSAPPAAASFGFKGLDLNFAEEDGSRAAQAGSHPFEIDTSIDFNTVLEGPDERPDGQVRNLEAALPAGLVGDPNATPRCSGADFAEVEISPEGSLPNCATGSVVGFVTIRGALRSAPAGEQERGVAPVYNLEPPPGAVARLGFVFLGVPVTMDLHVSPLPPYRVLASLTDSPQSLQLFGARLTLWGIPADPVHDPFRGFCLGGIEPDGSLISRGMCPAGGVEKPFLTLPRACDGPLQASFGAESWDPGEERVSEEITTHDDSVPPQPLGFLGCSQLGFDPRLGAQLTSGRAESPTGLDFALDVADEGLTRKGKTAQSDVAKIVAALPAGVAVNPAAANGLAACSLAQFEEERVGAPPGSGCPPAAKIGSAEVASPLVDEPLAGALYVAQPDANPFGSFLAVYLVLRNPKLGIVVRQAGEIEADSATGRLTATFDEIPQLPFSHLEVRFREGPRAPLATPPHCGDFVASAAMTPRANPTATHMETADFQVLSGSDGGTCPSQAAPLHPSFAAGTSSNSAATFAPLELRLGRSDGEQEITRFSAVLPPGLTGKLAGVGRCPDAAIEAARGKTGEEELAAPSCPASSAIGHVLAGAGVGPSPVYVSGTAYLAGPFAGDPLSVVAVTPAVAGPFDAGNVVVREALTLDPATAEVQIDGARSDPIPRILEGIPLRLRELRIEVDRPGFILNPTSCAPASVRATAFGAGQLLAPAPEVGVPLSARFQAANCSRLRFAPKLGLSLTGQHGRAGHPALRAVLQARPGEADVGRVAVTLPSSQFIDNARIANPCTRVKFDQGACPASSVLGHARAFTPLLDQPLEGPVYFRANGGERELPDIVADLRGEVHIVLVGFVDSAGRRGSEVSRVRTTFATVPDAPVSRFVLSLNGGRTGLLQNSRNLCVAPQRASVRMLGQNGRRRDFSQQIRTGCRRKR